VHLENDTIVAQATASGRAGIGVIRLSGPLSKQIASKLIDSQMGVSKTFSDYSFSPRYCHLTQWFDDSGEMIDEGLTIFFPGPASFTGEDVIELHAHGGVIILDWLIKQTIAYGARMARPGEFTERAFLNDKLDLAQAEAVASIIDASSRRAASSALRSLQGQFSEQIDQVVELLIRLRTHVEAAIDFVDEDLETDDIRNINTKLVALISKITGIIDQTRSGVILHEGARIAIVGEPNAGKSSLLNELAKTQAAIVSDIPGTTRDIVKERLELEGVPVEVLDTAGLRETSNPIEQQGINRAIEVLVSADLLLWVFDAVDGNFDSQSERLLKYCGEVVLEKPYLFVASKIDLLPPESLATLKEFEVQTNSHLVSCSVKDKVGVDSLIKKILLSIGVNADFEGQFIARRRHLEALQQTRKGLNKALEILHTQPLELVAEDLRVAQESINSITGKFTSDDLLGKIFSTFCVGK